MDYEITNQEYLIKLEEIRGGLLPAAVSVKLKLEGWVSITTLRDQMYQTEEKHE